MLYQVFPTYVSSTGKLLMPNNVIQPMGQKATKLGTYI